jgi:ribosome-associated translation inhibitor RaiA
MLIEVNTNNSVQGSDSLAAKVEAEVLKTLGRFADEITRVEVHLNDVNATKSGPADKRCMVEARPTGKAPVAVTDQADDLMLAVRKATRKLRRALDHQLGPRKDHKGRPTIRDADLPE